jgi:uncharacterized repeat protein (TIGR02543 family)
VSVSDADSGTVVIDGRSYTTHYSQHYIEDGESIVLLAIPSAGYTFTGWSGDLNGTDNPVEITIVPQMNIVANFSPIMHNLDIKVNGGGSTNPSRGRYSYAEGEIVTISAIPNSWWRFDSWSGDVSDSTSSTTKVSINAAKEITANFVKVLPPPLLPLIILIESLVLIIGTLWYLVTRNKSTATKRKSAAKHQ